MLQEYCMTFIFSENGLDKQSILQMRRYATDRLQIPKLIRFLRVGSKASGNTYSKMWDHV